MLAFEAAKFHSFKYIEAFCILSSSCREIKHQFHAT